MIHSVLQFMLIAGIGQVPVHSDSGRGTAGSGANAQQSNDGVRATGFGQAIVAVDDRDGDGLADLAIGAPYAYCATGRSGAVLLVSSATGAQIACWGGDSDLQAFGKHLGVVRHRGADVPARLVVISGRGGARTIDCASGRAVATMPSALRLLGIQNDQDRDGFEDPVLIGHDGRSQLATTVGTRGGVALATMPLGAQDSFPGVDWNGDGWLDVLSYPRGGRISWRVFSGDRRELLAQAGHWQAQFATPSAAAIVTAHLDSDERPDFALGLVRSEGEALSLIAYLSERPQTLVIRSAAGETVMTKNVPLVKCIDERLHSFVDVDADGVDDVLSSTVELVVENSLRCVSGRTAEVLWTSRRVIGKSDSTIAVLGDCDGDGVRDLAVSNSPELEFDLAPLVDGQVSILSGRNGECIRRIAESDFPEISLLRWPTQRR